MNCWQSNFKDKPLKDGFKQKDSVTDIDYDGYTFHAKVKSYDVELILQDNILFDMSCSCSRKSPCAHEAAALYFLDEFPDVLDEFDYEESEKIAKISVNDDLKIISDSKLKKFLKREFKKNPKLKYDFIRFTGEESLIDKKEFERKLKSILKRGKTQGFANHGFYDLSAIGSDLKKFIKKDISLLINQGEYKFAYNLLNEIMDIFIDQIYWDNHHWYDICRIYQELSYDLFERYDFTAQEMDYMMDHIRVFSDFVF